MCRGGGLQRLEVRRPGRFFSAMAACPPNRVPAGEQRRGRHVGTFAQTRRERELLAATGGAVAPEEDAEASAGGVL